MKVNDFLVGIGRPVAYYPKLRKVTGSVTSAILLCQLTYWTGKQADKNGWIYKTSDQIEDETGLTYKEQVTARKYLVEGGFIEEHYARLDHELRFRVLVDDMESIWEGTQAPSKPVSPEQPNQEMGNELIDESYNVPETTTQTTPEKEQVRDEPKSVAMPLEWLMVSGRAITEEDMSAERERQMKDAANLIATGTGINADVYRQIAMTFQVLKNIVLTDIKKNRKAIKDMLANGVTPKHVATAIHELSSAKLPSGKSLTVTDLMAVKKTAINVAVSQEQAKTHSIIEGI